MGGRETTERCFCRLARREQPFVPWIEADRGRGRLRQETPSRTRDRGGVFLCDGIVRQVQRPGFGGGKPRDLLCNRFSQLRPRKRKTSKTPSRTRDRGGVFLCDGIVRQVQRPGFGGGKPRDLLCNRFSQL